MNWHPIDTAPKDETLVFGWQPGRFPVAMGYAKYEEGAEGWIYADPDMWKVFPLPPKPTHWARYSDPTNEA